METIKTRMIIPVQAPCLIAYRDPLAGYFWLRPYVDLHLRSKIWGIAIHGLVFRLVHEEDGDWDSAKELRDTLSRATMPSTTALDVACVYQRDFNVTVELLKSLKIPAEPWRKGAYWSTEDDGDKATVMYMGKGSIGFEPKEMSNGYLRLVSRYVVKKPIQPYCPLAYLIDGRIKISLCLYPELKDKLWGIHVAKKYLCMKLTNEPKALKLNDGLALCKTLSTKELSVELPTAANVDDIGDHHDDLNDTFAILSAYKVNVDTVPTKDFYWLTSSLREGGFVTYGNRRIWATEPCICRLFAKNKGKTEVF